MKLKNKKIPDSIFDSERSGVLVQWPTGKDVDFNDAVLYHKSLPAGKVFSNRLAEAEKLANTLIQPRAGVTLLEDHIELLLYLQEAGEADLLPTTIDSYTRHNKFKDAEKGIEESIRGKRSMLNGFPAVNHGVSACRKVNESVSVPVEVRHGTPDARLLAEISIAGGFTSFEGGGISYNIPYGKNNSLEKTICDWQYVDRLVGKYEEEGVTINRETFGPLTGTLVPPCISHSVAVVESLLAAEQGVRNITVGYGQCGNLIQDVAAVRTLKQLTQEYLAKFGYNDVTVSTVLHQWMGGFPQDESKAYGVISWGAAAAVLSQATKVIVKSIHEAFGVPTKEANSAGLKATRQIVNMLKDQKMPATNEMETEIELILIETRCILDKLCELGSDDIAVGAVRAFEAGVIDVPFAPSRLNAGKAIPARDNEGILRFLDFGNLPFNDRIKDFHKSKIEQRARNEKRKAGFQMVIDDIYAISKGRLVGRPK